QPLSSGGSSFRRPTSIEGSLFPRRGGWKKGSGSFWLAARRVATSAVGSCSGQRHSSLGVPGRSARFRSTLSRVYAGRGEPSWSKGIAASTLHSLSAIRAATRKRSHLSGRLVYHACSPVQRHFTE